MRSKQGFALAYFLLVTVLVVMFVTTLFFRSRQQILATQSVLNGTKALYAAKAGVARVTAEMEQNAAWNDNLIDEALPSGQASYTIRFASDPDTATDMESINNLAGAGAVSSYRGSFSVPSQSALLVVTGKAGLVTRTVEVLLVQAAAAPPEHAIAATGEVSLNGEVEVRGLAALDDLTSTPAHVHSNLQDSGTVVRYQSSDPGQDMTVSGRLTSSGSSPDSIVLSGPASVAEGTQSQVPQRKLPRPNITAILDDHRGFPGDPIPTLAGEFVLSGNHYYEGNQFIQGDLVLQDNARIFVRGNLTINGSIQGNGAIVTSGDTELFGNSAILAGEDNEYISLLSGGNVTLKGFDGNQYLDQLTANAANPAEAQEQLSDLRWGLTGLQSYLEGLNGLKDRALDVRLKEDDHLLDSFQTVVAPHRTVVTPENDGKHRRTSLHLLNLLLADAPPSQTRDFLEARLVELNSLFRADSKNRSGADSSGNVRWAILDNFDTRDDFEDGGIFDALQSVPPHGEPDSSPNPDDYELQDRIVGSIARFDASRVGSADFKGFVYAEGALIVRDDLNVLGTVVVNGNPALENIRVDGNDYGPGDVLLQGNSRITHVDNLFAEGVKNLSGVGSLDVKRWINRN